LPPFDEPGEVRQWTDVLIDNRAVVSTALDQAGIGNRAFWFPLHRQEPYAADAKLFPNSTDISRRGLWLASRLDLTEAEMERVASTVIAALRRS
jgi:dTDP-4-amino-4,6-dideoxygalactose transaminase